MNRKYILFVSMCVLFGWISTGFGMQVNITPRVSLSEEYTDNVFLSETNKQDDFITVVTPGVTLDVLGQQAGISLSYDAGYSYYNEFDENNSWRHDAELSSWVDFSRTLRLELGDRYLYTEELYGEDDIAALRVRDPQQTIDPTLRPSREPYWTNTADIRLIKQFGPRDRAFVAYAYSIREDDDPTASDSEHHDPEIGATYWFLPHWALDTTMTYVQATFDQDNDFDQYDGYLRLIREFTPNLQGYVQYRHIALDYTEQDEGDLSEDYQVYIPSIGAVYNLAQDLQASLDVGYFHRNVDGASDQSGLSLRGDVTKTFQRGSLTLTLGTGHGEAYFGAETLGASQYYEAGVSGTYNLAQHLAARAFATYREDQYQDEDPERTDKLWAAGGGLSSTILPWLTVSLDYRYRDLNSDGEGGDSYTENSVILEATVTAPQPYRLLD